MPFEMKLAGFRELNDELKSLPRDLQHESAPILSRFANTARDRVVSAYPEISGALRAGVRVVERAARGVATLYTLATTAPHAHIYEFGSSHQRPRPTFLPISEPARRDAVIAVAELVESKGLEVRGDRD